MFELVLTSTQCICLTKAKAPQSQSESILSHSRHKTEEEVHNRKLNFSFMNLKTRIYSHGFRGV